MSLKPIPLSSVASFIDRIGQEWMLITAGSPGHFNMMTASWGGLGFLWERPVAFSFIRPTRHTFRLMEQTREYTLSFYPAKYRSNLAFCGKVSGKNTNKAAESGLTPLSAPRGTVSFAEASLTLVVSRLYSQDIDPERFVDPDLEQFYPEKDYHRLYIGEIVDCLEGVAEPESK